MTLVMRVGRVQFMSNGSDDVVMRVGRVCSWLRRAWEQMGRWLGLALACRYRKWLREQNDLRKELKLMKAAETPFERTD